jgi:hypothetical protein
MVLRRPVELAGILGNWENKGLAASFSGFGKASIYPGRLERRGILFDL